MAFVDHSHHKLFGSSNFLKEILKSNFEITNFWDDSWQGGESVSVDDLNKFDYVLFFQVLNKFHKLKNIKSKIIWVPMYDGLRFDYIFWKNLSIFPIKVLSFCRKIDENCRRFNLDFLSLKYFLDPDDYKFNFPTGGNHIFFWNRGGLKFQEFKHLINPEQFKSFTILSRPDPGIDAEYISAEDVKKYKIKLLKENKIFNRHEYLDFIKNCNIFIAPRKKEGIGLSFLEAMAAGRCVIGYNSPTLNEYITDSVNGLLINNKAVDLSGVEHFINNCKDFAEDGFNKWIRSIPKITQFIQSGYRDYQKDFFIFWYSLYLFFSVYLRVKYKLFNFFAMND